MGNNYYPKTDFKVFKKVIILSAKQGPGTVEKIYDLEEKRWYFAN